MPRLGAGPEDVPSVDVWDAFGVAPFFGACAIVSCVVVCVEPFVVVVAFGLVVDVVGDDSFVDLAEALRSAAAFRFAALTA